MRKGRLRLRSQRGSTLLLVLALVAVLTIVAGGMVVRTRASTEAATQKRHYDASVSCAEGARELLLGQFRAFNVNLTELRLDETSGPRRMGSGHYDQFNVTSVRPLAGAGALGSDSTMGMANRTAAVSLGGAPYVFTVVCADSTGESRQSEIEFFIRFGL